MTDGRMSGASGKVLAAIQVTPESVRGGLISRIRDGDIIKICSESGVLSASADDDIEARDPAAVDLGSSHVGMGRELFGAFRRQAGEAEAGASVF